MLNRQQFVRGIGSTALLSHVPGWAADAAAEPPNATARTVPVPIDHDAVHRGTFPLEYLVAGEIAPKKPTVLVIADGQQFSVRADAMPGFRKLFGDDVNIVGIPGRGSAKPLLDLLGDPAASAADWILAYRLLRYRQWVADIDAVRSSVLGKNAKILIFGTSGGAFLLHTYMAAFGKNVRAAYSEVAALPPMEAEIGLQHDKFWQELDEDDRKLLWSAITAHPGNRTLYAQLFQRQNYFVELDGLKDARHDLIAAIAKDDQAVIEKASVDYQVDAVIRMMSTTAAWSIRVREFEFVWPILGDREWKKTEFRPDVEVSDLLAKPLLDLQAGGKITAPTFDLRPLNDVSAEVLVVCGRYDHISDYREEIAIAEHYRNHLLLILDDDHMMHDFKAIPDARPSLVQAWTKGLHDPSFADALKKIEPIRWRES